MPTSIRWKFPVTMAAEEKAVTKAHKRIGKFYVARFGPSPSMLAFRTLFALDARCALAALWRESARAQPSANGALIPVRIAASREMRPNCFSAISAQAVSPAPIPISSPRRLLNGVALILSGSLRTKSVLNLPLAWLNGAWPRAESRMRGRGFRSRPVPRLASTR